MNKFIFLIIFHFFPLYILAQHGTYLLGENDFLHNSNEGCKIIKCTNNTSVIFGQSLFTPAMCIITKLDSIGNIIWFNSVGDENIGYETFISSGIQTLDNGFLMVGYSEKFNTVTDNAQVFKLDSLGNFEWAINYGGSEMDRAETAIQLDDESYIISGITQSSLYNSRFLIFKVDKNGTLLWNKVFNIPYSSNASIRTKDGGYVIISAGGGTNVLKFNNKDSLLWNTRVGTFSPSPNSLSLNVIVETYDHGFALAGFFSHDINSSDDLIVKLDNIGNILWSNVIDVGALDGLNGIIESKDKGVIAVGGIDYTGFSPGYGYITKFNDEGKFKWGRIMEDSCLFNSIVENKDGGYSIVGNKKRTHGPSIYLGILDSIGINCSNYIDTGYIPTENIGQGTPNLYSITAENFSIKYNGYDGATSFESTTICSDNIVEFNKLELNSKKNYNIIQDFENDKMIIISSDNSNIEEVKIFNLLGNLVYSSSEKFNRYKQELEIDISKLTHGVFILLIQDKIGIQNYKIIRQ